MSIRATLLEIVQRDGSLTPESVLAEAENESSPLHDQFCWDDTEAARRFRLWQASALIRRVKVTIQTTPEETKRVRAFVNIPDTEPGNRGVYLPTDVALAEHRDVVLHQAMRDVAALRAKYSALTDFDAVLRASLQLEEAVAS